MKEKVWITLPSGRKVEVSIPSIEEINNSMNDINRIYNIPVKNNNGIYIELGLLYKIQTELHKNLN